MFELLKPHVNHLPEYKAALQRGWSPANLRQDAATEQLAEIEQNPMEFIYRMDDVEARGGPVILPNGSTVPRLPGFRRWMWDNGFCGSVGFRWQKGTTDLPPHVLGHIGYATVPWRRGNGHATRALGLLLAEIKVYGLAYVDITTTPDNIVSQKVALANGGVLVDRFIKPAAYGDAEALRFRIYLSGQEKQNG